MWLDKLPSFSLAMPATHLVPPPAVERSCACYCGVCREGPAQRSEWSEPPREGRGSLGQCTHAAQRGWLQGGHTKVDLKCWKRWRGGEGRSSRIDGQIWALRVGVQNFARM